MSVNQRLQLLRQMQSAWRKFSVAKPLFLLSASLDTKPSIVKFHFTNEAVSYGHSESEDKIFLKRVQAGVSGVEDAGPLTVPQRASLSDFCMDPQQDVGVLATIHPTSYHSLHIQSLTTGQAHPLAAAQDIHLNSRFRHSLSLTMGADLILAACFERATGEHRGSRETPLYKLYNWKTGALHMIVHSNLTLLSGERNSRVVGNSESLRLLFRTPYGGCLCTIYSNYNGEGLERNLCSGSATFP